MMKQNFFFTLIFATLLFISAEVSAVTKGDIDDSKTVDLRDVIIAFQVCTEIPPSSDVHTDADVNEDGKIGLAEALYAIRQVALGKFAIDPSQINWEKTNGPGGGKIIDIAVDPTNNSVLYTAVYPISAGLLDGGIYKSTDGGGTWARKVSGINDKETWSITMDPNDNRVLWAGTNAGEIYKTADAAETWTKKKDISGDITNPTSNTIYCVEIDPFDSDRILAGSRHGYLFRSEDGGGTWETLYKDKGLMAEGVISDITYDPKNQGVVYLTTGFFDVWDYIGNGIYKSTDGGKTWQKLENGLQGKSQFGDLVIDPADSNVLYAANGMEDNPGMGVTGEAQSHLYRSEDAGESWELIDIGSQTQIHHTLTAVAVHPENSDKLYVMAGSEVFFTSTDRGNTWTVHKGTGIIGIGTLAEYDPIDSAVMYATSYAAGIFKSTDGGETWNDLNGKEIAFAYVDSLKADPSEPGTLYSQSFENGFHYTQDYGDTWQRGHHTSNQFATAFAFVEKPKTGPNLYIIPRMSGLIKKAEGPDKEWAATMLPPINGNEVQLSMIVADDADGDLLYAGTRNVGIIRTRDAGESWETMNNGLPQRLDVRSLVIDPGDENRMYAGSVTDKGRIWISADSGETWELLNSEMTFTTIHAMAADPSDENIVYAAPWGASLFKSSDAGETWTEIKGGNDESAVFSLSAIAVHPTNSDILMGLGRANQYLVRSHDGGQNWAMFWNPAPPESSPYFRLNSLTFDPNNPEIFYVSAWKPGTGVEILGDLFQYNEGTWKTITNGLPRAVLDVAADPSNSQTLYASTHIYGLYKSTDSGNSWQELSSFPKVGIFDLEFNDGALYAATDCTEMPEYLLGGLSQIEGECGLYKSSDRGNTWVNLLSGDLKSTPVKQVAFKDGKTYIATNNDAYVSSDETVWEPMNVPFKETATIEISGNKIYVGTHGGGVYQKAVGSAEWDNKGPFVKVLSLELRVSPGNSDVLYASAVPGGMFKSADKGKTWCEKNFAIPSLRTVEEVVDKGGYYTFVIDPILPDNLFLSIFGRGVYMSADGADTWTPVNTGLDNKDTFNIQMDASKNYLYVGTNGGSVYRTKLR